MSPDKQHGREAARRRAAQAATREAARRRRQRMRGVVVAVIAAVVVLALVLVMLPGSGGDDQTATITTSTSTDGTSTTEAVDDGEPITDDASATVSPPFEFGDGECAPDTKPEAPPESFDSAPRNCLKDDVDYKAVVGTSEGTFTIDLFEARAPGTVNNFIQLAKWGWFDDIIVHRVVPGFVNQTGDRTGTGSGNIGYTIPDELPPDVASYKKWAVAMANAGPNTNSSQWFTCIDCSVLPTAGYSLFGQVSDGTEVVQAINDLGSGDGPPTKEVKVIAVEIVEIERQR